jgi:hypothetical protein
MHGVKNFTVWSNEQQHFSEFVLGLPMMPIAPGAPHFHTDMH